MAKQTKELLNPRAKARPQLSNSARSSGATVESEVQELCKALQQVTLLLDVNSAWFAQMGFIWLKHHIVMQRPRKWLVSKVFSIFTGSRFFRDTMLGSC